MPLVLRNLLSLLLSSHCRFWLGVHAFVLFRNASTMAAIPTAMGVATDVPLILRKPGLWPSPVGQ